jgi:hypothetical protein
LAFASQVLDADFAGENIAGELARIAGNIRHDGILL